MKKIFSLLLCAIIFHICAYGQVYIYSKEGKAIVNRKHLVYMCLNMLKKPKADTVALAICECRVDKLDRRFSNKQYRQHTSGGVINLQALIDEDSIVNKEIRACFTNSGRTALLHARALKINSFRIAYMRTGTQQKKRWTVHESLIIASANCK